MNTNSHHRVRLPEVKLQRWLASVCLSCGALLWNGADVQAQVQTKARPARIGLVGYTPALAQSNHRAFLDGMRENGLIEGRDFVLEYRGTNGDIAKIAERSAELVRLPVDLMVVGVCGEWLDAPRRLTSTIPIVVLTCNEDMVESGIVQSLNHPGGNVTGQSKLTPQLAAKRLELLRQTLPSLRRVAVLWNPAYSEFRQDWRELRVAAASLGITLESVEFRTGSELGAAFDAVRRLRPDALMTFSDASTYNLSQQVAQFAMRANVPAIYAFREIPDAGGLMSYGPSITGMARHGASYVAKSLRGASPAGLPIELPTRFELVINLKTAKALGITVPPLVLLRADEVIE